MTDGDFFLKGFELYPEAALAVDTFEKEMMRRLRAVLEERSRWGPFTPKPGGRSSTGHDEAGYFICAMQNGGLGKKKAVIEVGYLWKPRFGDRSPVLYSKFYCDPEGLTRFRYDGMTSGITSVVEWDHTTLVSPLPRDLEPSGVIDRQLDVLVKVMNGG